MLQTTQKVLARKSVQKTTFEAAEIMLGPWNQQKEFYFETWSRFSGAGDRSPLYDVVPPSPCVHGTNKSTKQSQVVKCVQCSDQINVISVFVPVRAL